MGTTETWHEVGQRQLVFDHSLAFCITAVSMTGSAALRKLVVAHRYSLRLTMFDLDAPDGTPAQDIFRAHFADVLQPGYIQHMQARFLENDPRNLLVVAWSVLDRSGLQLFDVLTGTVVETLPMDIGHNHILDMAMAVTERCIALQVELTADTIVTMMFRQNAAGRWSRTLHATVVRPTTWSANWLSFQTPRAHEPSSLLELNMCIKGGLHLSGTDLPPRPLAMDGDAIMVTGSHDPQLVQVTGQDVVLVLLESQLLTVDPAATLDAEGRLTATVAHTFESSLTGGATYVPGYGLLVLSTTEDPMADPCCATLHHLLRSTMTPARYTWMRACVRRAR